MQGGNISDCLYDKIPATLRRRAATMETGGIAIDFRNPSHVPEAAFPANRNSGKRPAGFISRRNNSST
ncbi:hypothetical protein C5Q97_16625 [Victivallales bacterium CCUG 44730]|nr:hypothetical protein C5Q97_16625 [Victivallales bacterium CCUG 44730]